MIKIGIVTEDPPETDRSLILFRQLASQENCSIFVINPFDSIDEKAILNLDIAVPRISGIDEVRVKEQFDFFNSLVQKYKLRHLGAAPASRDLKDKFFQTSLAIKAGLLVPKTLILQDEEYDYLVGELGSPFVVKACYSYGGKDVFLVRSSSDMSKIIPKRSYIAQQFIELEEIVDYRVYVIGARVVSGRMRKNDLEGEFRSNTNQGGIGSVFVPDEELSSFALKYARLSGAEILSVDFIKKDDKYYFIESNDAFALNLREDDIDKKTLLARSILRLCRDRVLTAKEE